MAVWVVLQLVALAALTAFIISNLKRFRPKNFPPGEINQELAGGVAKIPRYPSHSQFTGPMSLPLLGSVLFLDVRNLGKSFKRLGSRYGDIFSIFIGRKPCVVLNSYPVIKEAFALPEFNGRPSMFSGTFFQKGKNGIITTEGSMWQAQREFFHQRMVDLVRGKGTQGFQVRLLVWPNYKDHLELPVHNECFTPTFWIDM